MITLTLTEQQVQVILAGLGELKLNAALDTFGTVQNQVMQQRKAPPPQFDPQPDTNLG